MAQLLFKSEILTMAWTSTQDTLGRAFWPLVSLTFMLMLFGLVIGGWLGVIPLVPWIIYGQFAVSRARRRFWQSFAKDHDWKFQPKGSWQKERALMFTTGHSKKMRNIVSGKLAGHRLRIFEYQYSTGSGKNQKTYYYTIFEAHFSGHFPHLYLNNLDNSHSAGTPGHRLPLPNEFEQQFHLYGPEQYEIEALEIFAPNILELLLHMQFPYDVELVEQELLVFTRTRIHSRSQLEEKLAPAERLLHAIAPKLNRMRFKPIGNTPHVLH